MPLPSAPGASAVTEEDWEDYQATILDADINAFRARYAKKDSSQCKIKLAEVMTDLHKCESKLAELDSKEAAATSGHDPLAYNTDEEQKRSKLDRTHQKLLAQQAFLEERAAMEPARARSAPEPGDDPPPHAAAECSAPEAPTSAGERRGRGQQRVSANKSTICVIS